jgi:stress-induced morphogen
MHNKGEETHFNISIISNDFKNLSAVKRHQMVYKILEKEL